jgi:hypothetical protein
MSLSATLKSISNGCRTRYIPSYLGSARLDERGEIIESNRNGHQ